MAVKTMLKSIALAALVASAFSAARAESCAVPVGAQAEIAKAIAATNAERRARGLPELKVSSALTKAAQGHACAMVRTDTFSHRLAGSSGPKARIRAAGCRTTLAAENIAMGYSSAEATMALWMKSSGHRRNILLRGVTSVGIALAAPRPGQGGGPRWVQVFAKGC
ncbi:CAP domain-containing protein [Ostreiculturibacter nitratireducens]|uniref:CAP domain-containing protein n=1 Tax=Ostreiculturibacter nitratireducens TaxID=3075226 RepID=UPI0031B64798